MKQINEKIHLLSYKDQLKSSVANSISNINGRMTFIDDNTCVFLFPIDDKASDKQNLELIKKGLKDLKNRLQNKISNIDLLFGISDIPHLIADVKRNYLRADQTIKVGKLVYPEEDYLTYSKLGVFAWMDIKEDELEIMSKEIELLIKSDQNNELIETLRAYLECKMNYSLAAKHLFVHINTVRKRIEDINDLISFDLEDPINRLKLEVLLKLIK
jgi:purine catabolism regulator